MALIHMNGRVYDPVLARFVTADPFIAGASDLQNYNRYTYVNNNPLAYTDPSGYFSFKKIFKIAAAIAVAVFAPEIGAFTGWTSAVTSATGISAFAANGILGGSLAGGILGGDFKSLVVGGITGGLFGGLHTWDFGLEKFLAHGAVGGLGNELAGGDFRSGFLSAGFAEFAGGNLNLGDKIANGIARVIVGGTASVIGGGKFENGAVTAAFAYLFNESARELRKQYSIGKGHHYFPFEVWPENLSEAAKREFGRTTTGLLEPGSHLRDRRHIQYGAAVGELFDSKGINPATMTTDQARAVIAEIKASPDPRISGYLSHLHAARVSPARSIMRGVGAFSIGIGLIPLVSDPGYTWRNYVEDSICGFAGGCSGAR